MTLSQMYLFLDVLNRHLFTANPRTVHGSKLRRQSFRLYNSFAVEYGKEIFQRNFLALTCFLKQALSPASIPSCRVGRHKFAGAEFGGTRFVE